MLLCFCYYDDEESEHNENGHTMMENLLSRAIKIFNITAKEAKDKADQDQNTYITL